MDFPNVQNDVRERRENEAAGKEVADRKGGHIATSVKREKKKKTD